MRVLTEDRCDTGHDLVGAGEDRLPLLVADLSRTGARGSGSEADTGSEPSSTIVIALVIMDSDDGCTEE